MYLVLYWMTIPKDVSIAHPRLTMNRYEIIGDSSISGRALPLKCRLDQHSVDHSEMTSESAARPATLDVCKTDKVMQYEVVIDARRRIN